MEESNSSCSNQSSNSSSCRWNPTKEQVTLLEGLYNEGIRTPTAQEIERITVLLRQHGHIEGKNVFYWFQNHKARLRQKQRQESSNALSAQSNVVCFRPFMYPPTFRVGCAQNLHGIHPISLLPVPANFVPQAPENLKMSKKVEEIKTETLELFPLHPEGLAFEANKHQQNCHRR